MKTKTQPQTCAKGTCDIGTQQNGVNKDYKRKCSNCNYETRQYNPNIYICPKCKKGMLYWSYEPQDGLTDYEKRMIAKFYGNCTDTKVVIQK